MIHVHGKRAREQHARSMEMRRRTELERAHRMVHAQLERLVNVVARRGTLPVGQRRPDETRRGHLALRCTETSFLLTFSRHMIACGRPRLSTAVCRWGRDRAHLVYEWHKQCVRNESGHILRGRYLFRAHDESARRVNKRRSRDE